MTREILRADPMARYAKRELFAVKDNMSDAEWKTHIRNHADAIYHPVGTCKMDIDDRAAVDPQLKVRGLQGLLMLQLCQHRSTATPMRQRS